MVIEKVEPKVSIEAVSDAMDYLGLSGQLLHLNPVSRRKKAFGQAYTVKFCDGNNKEESIAADYIDDVPPGSIIIIDNNDSSKCSVWGEILTNVAIRRKINGVLINGACRDINYNSKCSFPIFARHFTCKTGKGVVKLESVQVPVIIQGVIINPDDYVYSDNYNTIVIPYVYFDEVVKIASNIEEMERHVLMAVESGMSLKEARKKYKYNKYK